MPVLPLPAGARWENNRCAQALETAVMQRQNRFSDKTLNGDKIGDIFMRLIHSCRFNRVNSFADLLAMANHPADVK